MNGLWQSCRALSRPDTTVVAVVSLLACGSVRVKMREQGEALPMAINGPDLAEIAHLIGDLLVNPFRLAKFHG